jgi:hypothetical protein
MELGNFAEAESNLNALKDMNDYDYLIRLAKWNDHKGDLKNHLWKRQEILPKKIIEHLKYGLILIWVILWSRWQNPRII